MLTGLNRYVYASIAALALWAVVLAISPAMANAQATYQTQDQQETNREDRASEAVVVAPGDSLWSISAKWLGPEATTQQITDGVERIYALNRNRIGSDPNLLLAGQRLVLPSAVPSALERQAPERQAPEPGSAAREPEAAGAALAEAHREPQQSVDARPEPAPLPEPARATPVPAARSLAPHDSSPSLAQSVASEARSSFSTVVAAAGEAFPRGADSGRKLLGGALIAVSSVLAIILALQVARILWGPRRASRRARERWVREARRNYTYLDPFEDDNPYGGPFVALGRRPSERAPQEAGKLALVRGLRPLVHSGLSANGATSNGAASNGATSPDSARDIPRRRQIVDTELPELDASQEWEIGEPLRRSIGSIPLQPGALECDALSEVKSLAEDALATLALLERRRHLTDKEHHQARALRRFLATLEEAMVELKAG
ncbi:MAG TPA: LysM domain-containing protein [Rubrobacteraceae bacterium]|nr:LysM domain-containing protein [Rubrobacteraceae bacterium]